MLHPTVMASHCCRMQYGHSLLQDATWLLITEGCCMASNYRQKKIRNRRMQHDLSLLKDETWLLITEGCNKAMQHPSVMRSHVASFSNERPCCILLFLFFFYLYLEAMQHPSVMRGHAAPFSNEWPCSIFQ
jgi:hypothetical protein